MLVIYKSRLLFQFGLSPETLPVIMVIEVVVCQHGGRDPLKGPHYA